MAIYDQRAPQDFRFGQLSGAVTSLDTTLNSTSFTTLPSDLTTTKYMPITLADDDAGLYETVWLTAHSSSSNAVTAVRGREGSSAKAWAAGTTWRCAPTIRDGMLVLNRAGLPTDAHLGTRVTLSDESLVVEKTAVGWHDSAPFRDGRRHGWKCLNFNQAHNVDDTITWTADAGNPTIATLTGGNTLKLNRAGFWTLQLMGQGDNATAWMWKMWVNWASPSPFSPTWTDLLSAQNSNAGFAGGGEMWHNMHWTGYVSDTEAAANVTVHTKQINSTSGVVSGMNAWLSLEYLGG